MKEKVETKKENKSLTIKEIINIAYTTALSCYGVVGVSRFDAVVLDNYDTLPEERAYRGVIVRKIKANLFDVDLYIILSSEVKLTEASYECQKVVRYALNKASDRACRKVNVYVTAIK